MCEALRELMKEDLDAARASGKEQARKELIINSFKNNRTAEEIAEFLNIPLEEVKVVEALLKNE